MKKYGLVMVFMLCFVSSACLGQDEIIVPKLDIRKTIEIKHPLLEKVFPGVKLVEAYDYRENTPIQHTFGYYKEVRYSMPDQVNEVYAKVADRSSATIEERLRAYVILAYWKIDPQAEIINLQQGTFHESASETNYKILIRLNPEKDYKSDNSMRVLYISFKDDQIWWVEEWQNSKREKVFPVEVIYGTDNITLEITGIGTP